MEIKGIIISLSIAYALDIAFGDPCSFPHPVRYIGRLIRFVEEKIALKAAPVTGRIWAGVLLTLVVVGATFLAVHSVLVLAKLVSPLLYYALTTYFIYTSLATRCLCDEAGKVCERLSAGDIEGARSQVSMLVGRDTSTLTEEGIAKATVETTAENSVDGILSPLFYAFAGSMLGIGAPLVMAFKAASTLDSMVGYRNEMYEELGKASARLDDALNYVPARMSGLLIPLSAFIMRYDFAASFLIMMRDRRNHISPNCAYPESSYAGALGIRLGGPSTYFGSVVEKPYIGDARKSIDKSHIRDSIRLTYATSFIGFATIIAILLMLAR